MFAFEISSAWQATHPRVSLISLYTTAYHSATLEVPLLEVRFISKQVELGEFSSETNKAHVNVLYLLVAEYVHLLPQSSKCFGYMDRGRQVFYTS